MSIVGINPDLGGIAEGVGSVLSDVVSTGMDSLPKVSDLADGIDRVFTMANSAVDVAKGGIEAASAAVELGSGLVDLTEKALQLKWAVQERRVARARAQDAREFVTLLHHLVPRIKDMQPRIAQLFCILHRMNQSMFVSPEFDVARLLDQVAKGKTLSDVQQNSEEQRIAHMSRLTAAFSDPLNLATTIGDFDWIAAGLAHDYDDHGMEAVRQVLLVDALHELLMGRLVESKERDRAAVVDALRLEEIQKVAESLLEELLVLLKKMKECRIIQLVEWAREREKKLKALSKEMDAMKYSLYSSGADSLYEQSDALYSLKERIAGSVDTMVSIAAVIPEEYSSSRLVQIIQEVLKLEDQEALIIEPLDSASSSPLLQPYQIEAESVKRAHFLRIAMTCLEGESILEKRKASFSQKHQVYATADERNDLVVAHGRWRRCQVIVRLSELRVLKNALGQALNEGERDVGETVLLNWRLHEAMRCEAIARMQVIEQQLHQQALELKRRDDVVKGDQDKLTGMNTIRHAESTDERFLPRPAALFMVMSDIGEEERSGSRLLPEQVNLLQEKAEVRFPGKALPGLIAKHKKERYEQKIAMREAEVGELLQQYEVAKADAFASYVQLEHLQYEYLQSGSLSAGYIPLIILWTSFHFSCCRLAKEVECRVLKNQDDDSVLEKSSIDSFIAAVRGADFVPSSLMDLRVASVSNDLDEKAKTMIKSAQHSFNTIKSHLIRLCVIWRCAGGGDSPEEKIIQESVSNRATALKDVTAKDGVYLDWVQVDKDVEDKIRRVQEEEKKLRKGIRAYEVSTYEEAIEKAQKEKEEENMYTAKAKEMEESSTPVSEVAKCLENLAELHRSRAEDLHSLAASLLKLKLDKVKGSVPDRYDPKFYMKLSDRAYEILRLGVLLSVLQENAYSATSIEERKPQDQGKKGGDSTVSLGAQVQLGVKALSSSTLISWGRAENSEERMNALKQMSEANNGITRLCKEYKKADEKLSKKVVNASATVVKMGKKQNSDKLLRAKEELKAMEDSHMASREALRLTLQFQSILGNLYEYMRCLGGDSNADSVLKGIVKGCQDLVDRGAILNSNSQSDKPPIPVERTKVVGLASTFLEALCTYIPTLKGYLKEPQIEAEKPVASFWNFGRNTQADSAQDRTPDVPKIEGNPEEWRLLAVTAEFELERAKAQKYRHQKQFGERRYGIVDIMSKLETLHSLYAEDPTRINPSTALASARALAAALDFVEPRLGFLLSEVAIKIGPIQSRAAMAEMAQFTLQRTVVKPVVDRRKDALSDPSRELDAELLLEVFGGSPGDEGRDERLAALESFQNEGYRVVKDLHQVHDSEAIDSFHPYLKELIHAIRSI